MTSLNKIKKTMRQLITAQKDMEMVVQLGNLQGVIKADNNNNVYVTLLDGEVMTVLNQSVPNIRSYVVIGYKNRKSPLQVLRSLNAFPDPLFPDLPDHEHTWGKSVNPSWIRPEQFLPGLVLPIRDTLTVQIIGQVFWLNDAWHLMQSTIVDLSAEIPTTGAKYILVEGDEAGTITLTSGSVVASREVLEYSDVPLPTSGLFPWTVLKAYAGQVEFLKTLHETDIIDIRWARHGSGGGGGSSTSITLPKIGTPVNNTLTDDFTARGSAGVIDGTLVYVDMDAPSGAHHVKVIAGEGYIRIADDQQGALKFFEWSAVNGIDIPVPAAGDITVRYIGVEYNAGTPQVTVRTAWDWNFYDDFHLARVTHDGTSIHIFNEYAHAEDIASRTQRFLRNVLPFVREEAPEGTGGFEVSYNSSRNLSMTGGNLWQGLNRYIFGDISLGTPFTTYYRRSGGGFNMTSGVTALPNTQYDDGSGTLQTAANSMYLNMWIYLDVSAQELAVVYGRDEYNYAALAAQEALPTIPDHLSVHGVLLARFIFVKNWTGSTAPSITSAWQTPFAPPDFQLFAPAHEGVYRGSDHEHVTGDGAPINYSSIVGTPDVIPQAVFDDDFLLGEGTFGQWIPTTLANVVLTLRTILDSVYQAVGSYLTDAPSDGNYYGRLNGAWTNLKTYFDTLYSALGHSHSAPDASVVTYTPVDNTDWNSSTDPGDVDNALDQLADRTKTLESTPASGGLAIFGDGVDGNAVLDGVNTFPWCTLSGSTYTQIRDVYLDELTVDSGIILICRSWRIFAKTSVTNDGTIHANGENASGATQGTVSNTATLPPAQQGGAGIASGAAAGAGSAPSTADNELLGAVGGRGAGVFLTAITHPAGSGSDDFVNLYPAAPIGGWRNNRLLFKSMFEKYHARTDFSITTFRASTGGGGGAKSAVGTSCNSGGGGSGGYSLLICAKTIVNTGTISANGGNGGNAGGTAANAGGGGGGGGGIVWLVYGTLSDSGTIQANGGAGGTSVALGTTPLKAVARNISSAANSGATITNTVTAAPAKNTLYLLSIHVQGLLTPTSVVGWGLTWNLVTSVDFNSIASPARRLLMYSAYGTPNLNDDTLNVVTTFASTPTSARAIIDEIQNATGTIVQSATNRVDSATTLTVTLAAVGSTNAAIYGVFARSAGTLGTAGAGFVEIVETAAAILDSEMGYNDTTVDMTHTTAAAVAGIAVEIQAVSSMESGQAGLDGQVIYIQN